jgi:hypothetical protein
MLLLAWFAPAHAADRPFDVRPFGWVRPGFFWRQDDDALVNDTDGFWLSARLGLEAQADSMHLAARVEVDLQPEPVLKDAFVNWTPATWISVNAGQLKVPFSIQQLTSDTRRQLPVDAPLVAAAGFSRDIGAWVDGRLPIAGKTRAALSSAVMNGEGANRLENVNDRFLFAQRLLVTPLGARERPVEGTQREPYLGFGGGWVYNDTGSEATEEETNTFQAELQFAIGPFSVQGEFMDKDVQHASTEVADYHATAAYGQMGCFIPVGWAKEHLEIVGRGSWTEPNDALATTTAEVATVSIDAGVNLYAATTPRWLNDVKVQTAFRHTIQLEGDELDDDRIDVLGTVRF